MEWEDEADKALLDHGFNLFSSGRNAEARETFEDFLRHAGPETSHKQLQVAHFNLANVCRTLGDREASLAHYRWFLNAEHGLEEQACRGRSAALVGTCASKWAPAAHAEGFQAMHLVHLHIAELLADHAEIEEAILSWGAAIKAAGPTDQDFRAQVGHSLRSTLARVEQSLKSYPSNFDLLVAAGLLHDSIGDKANAKKHLKKAIKMKPKHKNAKVNFVMGRIAGSEGSDQSAEKNLRRALKLQPMDSMGWLSLGNTYDTNGKQKDALDAYGRGIEADPQDHLNVVSAVRMLQKMGRDDERSALAQAAVARGVLFHEMQTPSQLIGGLTTKPWHDATSWRVRRVLLEHFDMLHAELVALVADGTHARAGISDTESLATTGDWTELNLFHMGRTDTQSCALVPRTADVVQRFLPEAVSMVHGATKISVLTPGTQVRPHSGPSNARMRVHLGIAVPPGASISVGGERGMWLQGDVIAFDDSFEHWVEHTGDAPRIVLIVDVWHPDMDEKARLDSLVDDAQDGKLQRYLYHKDMYKNAGLDWF